MKQRKYGSRGTAAKGPGDKKKVKKVKTRRATANPKATKKTNRYGF